MRQNGNGSASTFRLNSIKSSLPDYDCEQASTTKSSWVGQNTAILVVHGIGHQKQNETLDMFARGVLEKYQVLCKEKLTASHHIEVSEKSNGLAFQNVIRINHPGSSHHIDIYEYYWAYCTEDKASLSDINGWLHGVVAGAKKFYDRNKELGEKYGDSSPFFKDGKFIGWKYDLFLNFFVKFYLLINTLITITLKLVSFIPFIGGMAEAVLKNYMDKAIYKLTNLLGDIVIYNVTDEKSKFYCVRVEILEGAVTTLKGLLEKTQDGGLAYPSVIVAGHSLGSQIAYDAINRINLLTSLGKMKHYQTDGTIKPSFSEAPKNVFKISDQLRGFITFGSPLDKIVFFLRENIPDDQYLRQQITDSYNCFKQREWTNTTFDTDKKIKTSVRRLLDDIQWHNYYDREDIISGGLDYFINVRNVDCLLNDSMQFRQKKSRFTHSHYWDCKNFYEDIIRNFLEMKHSQTIISQDLMTQKN